MICRSSGEGLLLITQEDHAALAGRIAAHWGNEAFPDPEPREAVLAAIAGHDAGWTLHDGEPTLNGSRHPAAFYEMPVESYLRMWVASVSASVARGGPMTGLIVSWYFCDLAKFMPTEHLSVPVRRLLDTFLESQRARQQEYCETLGLSDMLLEEPVGLADDKDRVALYNYGVLKTCDWLSLMVCAGRLPDFLMAASSSLLPNGSGPVDVQWLDTRTLACSPWPLDVRHLPVSIPARRVPDGIYRGRDDLQRVYDAAHAESYDFKLVAGP